MIYVQLFQNEEGMFEAYDYWGEMVKFYGFLMPGTRFHLLDSEGSSVWGLIQYDQNLQRYCFQADSSDFICLLNYTLIGFICK